MKIKALLIFFTVIGLNLNAQMFQLGLSQEDFEKIEQKTESMSPEEKAGFIVDEFSKFYTLERQQPAKLKILYTRLLTKAEELDEFKNTDPDLYNKKLHALHKTYDSQMLLILNDKQLQQYKQSFSENSRSKK